MRRTASFLLLAVVWAAASVAAASEIRPIAGGIGPDGWTVFEKSPDSRVIYVSSSAGSDENPGLSPDAPLKTLEKAMSMLRDGYPDWVLLKRGDVWYESLGRLSKSGRSIREPIVISSYGESPERPLLKLGDQGQGISLGDRPELRNIAIAGLHFYDEKGDPTGPEFVADRDKRTVAISWMSHGENFLVENCRFEYTYGIVGMGSIWMPEGQSLPDKGMHNFQVRRCVAEHAWTSSGHCQGIFLNKVHGILLEENVLDHNGYNQQTGDLPTWFNHNVYITIRCDNVVARGNIIARGSSTGLYCRTNGVMEDNLCIDNTPSLNLGRINEFRPGGVTGRIAGNVVFYSNPRSNRKHTFGGRGLEAGNVNMGGAVIENNILVDAAHTSGAFKLSPLGIGVHNVVLRNNTVYNWTNCLDWVGTPGASLGKHNLSGIVIRDNLFQVQEARGEGELLIRNRDTNDNCGFAWSGNVCWFEPQDAPCVVLGDREITLAEWLREPGVEDRAAKVRFADPSRNVAGYHGSLGREATLEAFLQEAYKQSRHNWRPEYTAAAVIEYVREGFRPVTDVEGAGAVPAR